MGNFYYGVYHTLVLAPATSNTVAKCVVGVSDNLATNVFAQAGKCRVPTIVFACDTAPELETRAPKGMVMVYPRRVDLENTDKLKTLRGDRGRRKSRGARGGGDAPAREEPELDEHGERLLFVTGRLALPRLERMVASFGEAARDWRIHDIGVKVAALMTQKIIARRLPRPVQADRVSLPGRCRADLAALSENFGVAFERGPEEIADLPVYLGRRRRRARSLAPRHAHLRRDRRRLDD